ncbi:MAG: metallophosphoesterase [Verrucomicrobiota bacterium]|nr:metallophosphoesterase [Verrucomicrobiota bacterium]
MRIAHLSDLHYAHFPWNLLRLCSKRFLGVFNWLSTRRSRFSYEPLESLPGLFRDLGVDLVLFGGDFTTTALEEEYAKAASFVQKLSLPWFAVPGNHDHYTGASVQKELFYRSFSHPKSPFPWTLKKERIELQPLAENWWLVALDTAVPTSLISSRGLFTEQQEHYFEEILGKIPKGDSLICLAHYPFFPQPSRRRELEGKERLRALLERSPQVRLYLQGHTHRHAIADLQESSLPILLDSGSCTQKEGSWNIIDLMSDHCAVSAYHWRKGAWTPFRKEIIPWKIR